MEFSFQVYYDEIRELSSWCFSEDFDSIVKRKERMQEAHHAIMDMFIAPVPLMMCFVSGDNTPPRKGQIAKDVFLIPPTKFDFGSQIFMINGSFLSECTNDCDPCEIFNIIGQSFGDPKEGIDQLDRWESENGLICVSVY